MAIYSDMNGFPESGFPVLADVSDRIVLGALYQTPLKPAGFMIDVVGANRLLGALTLGGALTGVTSLTMGGALSGVTNLTMTGNLAISGSIGSILARVVKGWFGNLEITNIPTVNGEPVALIADLARYDRKKDIISVWAAGIDYISGALIYINSKIYSCNTDHTSNVFATDFDAPNSYWDLIAFFSVWASGIAYYQDEIIITDAEGGVEKIYKCLISHIAGVFVIDLASNYWILVGCIDKASGAEVDIGTDNEKYITALAMEDSTYIKNTGSYNLETTGNIKANNIYGILGMQVFS